MDRILEAPVAIPVKRIFLTANIVEPVVSKVADASKPRCRNAEGGKE